MTETQQAAGADEPVNINALGPHNAAEQQTVTKHFDSNPDAVDAKTAEALKAQTAPNPTTDADLAREAYGDNWERRRGGKVIGHSNSGAEIRDHGGVAVDDAGHALGHSSDPAEAERTRNLLEDKPNANDADRFPVTAEAKQRDRKSGRFATPAKTDEAADDSL